jgi:hypothetical protein
MSRSPRGKPPLRATGRGRAVREGSTQLLVPDQGVHREEDDDARHRDHAAREDHDAGDGHEGQKNVIADSGRRAEGTSPRLAAGGAFELGEPQEGRPTTLGNWSAAGGTGAVGHGVLVVTGRVSGIGSTLDDPHSSGGVAPKVPRERTSFLHHPPRGPRALRAHEKAPQKRDSTRLPWRVFSACRHPTVQVSPAYTRSASLPGLRFAIASFTCACTPSS